jgi:hypothetical protein
MTRYRLTLRMPPHTSHSLTLHVLHLPVTLETIRHPSSYLLVICLSPTMNILGAPFDVLTTIRDKAGQMLNGLPPNPSGLPWATAPFGWTLESNKSTSCS